MTNATTRASAAAHGPYTFTIATDEFRRLPIPGLPPGARVGDCFVRVTALPDRLSDFMKVNPRVPTRKQNGVLSGPVVKGIRETLTENPEDMAIKNQGIYLLADSAEFERGTGGSGKLQITLADADRHGLVNGGHTFATIRDTIESVEDSDDDVTRASLSRAYVRLHILEGLEPDKVAEIAEGLNRSKQVDDPSLAALQGHFDAIRAIMKGKHGADSIAYNQGGPGDIYVTEILVALEMFNRERFDNKRHPHYLLSRSKSALDFYQKDLDSRPCPVDILVPKLPEILELSDMIKQQTPAAAKRVNFEFGRLKLSKKLRAGSERNKNNVLLPFLNAHMDYRVPNGWVYPMLAAFRANADWDLAKRKFEWKVPLRELVPQVIDDLVRVCVTEHRDNPDKVGKRESPYVQCYDKVHLHLLETGKN